MTPKRVRIETAHRGYVDIRWAVDGLHVTIGRDGRGFSQSDKGDVLTAEEDCSECKLGGGCHNTKWAGPAPSAYIVKGGKSKSLDEMDPLDRRGSR